MLITKQIFPIIQIAAAAVFLVVLASPVRADDFGLDQPAPQPPIQTESPFAPADASASAQTGRLSWLKHELVNGITPMVAVIVIGAAFWPVVPRRGEREELAARPAKIPPLRPRPSRIIRF